MCACVYGRSKFYSCILAALRRVAKNQTFSCLIQKPNKPKKAKDVQVTVKHHKGILSLGICAHNPKTLCIPYSLPATLPRAHSPVPGPFKVHEGGLGGREVVGYPDAGIKASIPRPGNLHAIRKAAAVQNGHRGQRLTATKVRTGSRT